MKIDIRKLDVKKDERGWLTEAIKPGDVVEASFGLIHITCAKPGYERGGHYHKRKTEWFCVIKGEGKFFLKDLKSGDKKTLKVGRENMSLIKIPPYIFHSIKNTGKDDMYILAYVNEGFDPKDTDTYRELS
ncbi:WxcM-like domain-containing protein [Candidatus Daviesbacteria bacterium]|nr:WxcM-like domain-containing protein [Candidatus Daviesbacteria bacterium]